MTHKRIDGLRALSRPSSSKTWRQARVLARVLATCLPLQALLPMAQAQTPSPTPPLTPLPTAVPAPVHLPGPMRAASAATAASPPSGALRRDLFARPAAAAPQPGARIAAEGRGITVPPPAPVDAPWAPQLTTVVVAKEGAMAVVNGAVLRLGDMLDGHRLVRVGEREAEFSKDGKPVLLRMRLAARPSPAGGPAPAAGDPARVPPTVAAATPDAPAAGGAGGAGGAGTAQAPSALPLANTLPGSAPNATSAGAAAAASAPGALTPPGLMVPGGIPIPAPAARAAHQEPS